MTCLWLGWDVTVAALARSTIIWDHSDFLLGRVEIRG